ncbi:MAG: hypothetical protein CMI18_11200 [Opitutaceae bacterium]|nr:hypothetical protein [Opitutaceae bacterium]|tara:strand:+ start:1961 stop:2551 length:591 start_codon:yes stop_codon:yes gene_type:complete
MKNSEPFQHALAAFDLLNAQDPNHRIVNGKEVPFELFFANKMTEWVFRLDPDASEAVRLAARCQHLCRWEISRSSYPEGRVGYLTWRKDLKTFHANKNAEVLINAGYNYVVVERVRSINLKKGLGKDPELQLIEDALCLVFLEHQYDDLIAKTSEEKMINILQKTWGKMSEKAHEFALEMQYSDLGQRLLDEALAS